MSTDDLLTSGDDTDAAERLEPYLDARAGRIVTGAPDMDRVVSRAGQRRRRRRTGAAVATVAALTVGVIGVARVAGQDAPTTVDFATPPGATSTTVPAGAVLDWHLVRPTSGLGMAAHTASVAGATFGLSTAPGSPRTDEATGAVDTLYRTTDGQEWEAVGLPSGFRPTALGGSSDRLYAVGTVAAGGSYGVSVAGGGVTGDLGAPADLPLDLAALAAQAGAPVGLSDTSVAAGHDHVVVAVTVQSAFDELVRRRIPSIGKQSWIEEAADGNGVEVGHTRAADPVLPAGSVAPTSAPEPAGGTVPDAPAPLSPDELKRAKESATERVVEARYTWAQLGITADQLSFTHGRVFAFASADGTSFTPIALPPGLTGRAQVLATTDGYRLISGSYERPTTEVFRSTDLATWSGPTAVPGQLRQAGIVAGRVVVITDQRTGGFAVHREEPGTPWSTLDLTAVADTGGNSFNDVSIGPMGIAAASWASESHPGVLVYSADGVSATATPIPTESEGVPTALSTVTVGTDAVTVALTLGRTTQADGRPAMALFVGVRP